MQTFDLVTPGTKEEVLALMAEADEDTRLIAGGTGLLNLVKQRLASPARLVSLHKVTGLGGIDWTQGNVVIGALERLLDIERNARVAARLPILRQVLHEVASPRIRGMATLGGALAHADPNEDTPLALMALDTTIIVESAGGTIEYAAADFYRDYYETVLGPDQLITAVRIETPRQSSRFGYKKFTPASREDYACVNVCIRLDLEPDGSCSDSRIILGSLGPTVFRASEAEASLAGRTITAAAATAAAQAASQATDPVDDARGSAAYKRKMAEVWVRRLLLQLAENRGR